MKIPLQELMNVEAQCTSLADQGKDYMPLVRDLGIKYGASINVKPLSFSVGHQNGPAMITLQEAENYDVEIDESGRIS